MPEGKGYTEKQIMKMRDEGVLSPGEIENLLRTRLPAEKTPLAGTRRSRSQGYKYFPDN